MQTITPTTRLLLAAAAALVSDQRDREGDDTRDNLLGELGQQLRDLGLSRPEHLIRDLIAAAVWDSTPEQLPQGDSLNAAAKALADLDAERDAEIATYEALAAEGSDDAFPQLGLTDLFSRADLERMDPSSGFYE